MSKERLTSICFWTILAITLLYLNGLFTSFFNTSAFFSPLILISCLIIIFYTPKPKYYSSLFIILIAFFVAYLYFGTLSIINYPNHLHPKTNLLKLYRGYISSILIFWAIYQYLTNLYITKGKQNLINILDKSSYFILLPLFFTVFGKELGLTEAMSYVQDYRERQIGIFTNPNTTGLHANYVLCFCLYSIIFNKKGKLLWLLLVPVCCYAAFLSLSKAAILMAILNVSFFMLFNIFYFRKLELSGKFISIISISIILFSSIYIYSNFDRLLSGLTLTQAERVIDAIEISKGKINDKTTSERAGLAKLAFPKIKEHLILGNGFGSFHRIKEHGLGAHNTALLIIGESGVIPSLLFLVFIGLYFYKAMKQKEVAFKYLFSSIMLTFLFIAFLTSHNALDERISNVILGICITFLK